MVNKSSLSLTDVILNFIFGLSRLNGSEATWLSVPRQKHNLTETAISLQSLYIKYPVPILPLKVHADESRSNIEVLMDNQSSH